MRILFSINFIFALVGSVVFGQEAPKNNPWQKQFQLGLSAASQQFTTAPAFFLHHGFGAKQRFRLGGGIRYNFNWNQNQKYRTAPAHLTSGQEGPQVLFSEDKPENIDTLTLGSAQFHSLNLAVFLAWQFSPKWEVGFNIDAAGFSFGPKASGDFASLQGNKEGLKNVSGKPYPYNLLLVSDNDLGSLNSELYGQYHWNQNWAIRFGATFIFSEIQTDIKPALDNDRFRNKSLQGMLGLTYRF
jgi:hypothetical protein